MKRIMTALLVAALVLMLTGCGKGWFDTNLNLNFNIFTASFPPCLR